MRSDKFFPKTKPVLLGLIVATGVLISWFRLFDLYELQTYDWRCQLRGPRPVSDKIVMIDIWDDTLAQLGAWPISREYHAHLIHILSEYGAQVVVFDVLFSDPREHDDAVVQAAQKAQNVYFAFAFSQLKGKSGSFTAQKIESDAQPSYRQAARGVGFVNARADMDGKRRRTMPVIHHEGQTHYQLSFRAAMDILGVQPEECDFKPGKYFQFSDRLRVPLDEDGCLNISYAGPWGKDFRHISYVDILYSHFQISEGRKPRLDLEDLRGKICIVGLTSQGSQDISPVPIQSVYPMVGSYANVLNGLLLKDFIYRADRWVNLLVLVLLAALVSGLSLKYRPVKALYLTMALAVLFLTAALLVFFAWGLWIDLFYPLVALAVVYATCTFTRILTEMKKRELLENELKIASQIQKSFLPETLPQVPRMGLAVFMKPAKAVGGDLYTFLKFSESKLGVMVGDVSGKGMPAALFMAKTVSEFKYSARDRTDPAVALFQLNNSISAESTGGLFVTMTYAIFDLEVGKLWLSNGGHLPVAVARKGAGPELITAEEGMPIGVMGEMPYGVVERSISSGEVFAFYSDGISEARNRKKEEYGTQRLQENLGRLSGQPAQRILDGITSDVHAFIGKADQHDDMTLIIVKIEGP